MTYGSGVEDKQLPPPRIHFSIHAPRLISPKSEVHQAVMDGNLPVIRRLFETRKASIWDVDSDGNSTFSVSYGLLNNA